MRGIRGVAEVAVVPDDIAAANAVARQVLTGVGADALEADEPEADVVVVMDQIAADLEAVDVAVERKGFTLPKDIAVNFIAAKNEVADGLWHGAVNGDAIGVGAAA